MTAAREAVSCAAGEAYMSAEAAIVRIEQQVSTPGRALCLSWWANRDTIASYACGSGSAGRTTRAAIAVIE